MANPFLVLGGVAVGIITAAVGVLSVPGWVKSAQDASALHDVNTWANIQAISMTKTGEYTHSLEVQQAQERLGVTWTPSEGVMTCVTVEPFNEDAYVTFSRSASGAVFVQENHGPILEGNSWEEAAELIDFTGYPDYWDVRFLDEATCDTRVIG